MTANVARPNGPRWPSPLEVLAGAELVIGHNVWSVLPNEVPILFAVGLICFRLCDEGWAATGWDVRNPGCERSHSA